MDEESEAQRVGPYPEAPQPEVTAWYQTQASDRWMCATGKSFLAQPLALSSGSVLQRPLFCFIIKRMLVGEP